MADSLLKCVARTIQRFVLLPLMRAARRSSTTVWLMETWRAGHGSGRMSGLRQ